MRLALAQFSAEADKEANLKVIGEYVAAAADGGARLVIFPEVAMFFMAQPDDQFVAAAEPVDGPFAQAVADLARRHRISVLYGGSETVPGEDRVYNTLVALGADGSLLGTYRKLHLYDAFGYLESERVRPGEHGDPLTFPVDDLVVGALTCYDVRFPEAFRQVVDAGAQVVALPAAWAAGPRKEAHWDTLVRARAIENTVYVAACGQTPPRCCGNSALIDPMGIAVSALGEAAGITFGDVHVDRVEAVRAKNPSLANRRFTVSPR
ncbi:carbon-nitrogen hydrolase family protein [Fodinicola acaciae]|uniref:carbon-nitrogen hydrolase family protein n=1 Tax=Fodinicola acaciae TaxID=2681555 RepID=UPI0013D08B5D|nr:carbon-nitrogen hydrolase family protein [Fodinicola acaciae]